MKTIVYTSVAQVAQVNRSHLHVLLVINCAVAVIGTSAAVRDNMTLWSNQALHIITDALVEEEQNHTKNDVSNSSGSPTSPQLTSTTTAVSDRTLQQHHHSNSTRPDSATNRHRSNSTKNKSSTLFRRSGIRPHSTINSLNGTNTNVNTPSLQRVSVDVAEVDNGSVAEPINIHIVNTDNITSDNNITDGVPTIEVMPSNISAITKSTVVSTPEPSWLHKFKQYFTTSTTSSTTTVPAASDSSPDSTTTSTAAIDATGTDDVIAIAESIASTTDASTRSTIDHATDHFDEMYDSEYDEQQHINHHDHEYATTYDDDSSTAQHSNHSSNGRHADDAPHTLPIHLQLAKTASRTARLHKVCNSIIKQKHSI
jgi:hypothetical protein